MLANVSDLLPGTASSDGTPELPSEIEGDSKEGEEGVGIDAREREDNSEKEKGEVDENNREHDLDLDKLDARLRLHKTEILLVAEP